MSLGWQIVSWWETLLCHGPGDVEGDPLDIDDELLAFTVGCYALDPATGRRLVNEAVLSRAKGRAKSEIAGMFAIVEGLGPVRFSHWAERGETSWWGYQFEAGEPVGAPVRSPLVRILATEEGQTGNTYDNVRVMLARGRIAGEVDGLDVGLTRTILPGSGRIEPCTAGSASKDGGRETFAVADEGHLYTLPELRRMYATVRRNLTKRKIAEPWMLQTTTWFQPGEGSVAETSWREATAIAEGKVRNTGLLYDHLHGIPPDNPTDDRALRKALVVAAGAAAPWMDIDRRLADIRRADTDWDDACRYYLNTLDAGSEDLIELVLWRALAGIPGPDLEDGDVVALGFDGSDSGGDLTALVAVRWPDWRIFVLDHWAKPATAGKEWRVPRLDVDAAVAAAFDRFRVIAGYFDPPYWRTEIDQWAAQYGDKAVKAFATFSDTKMVAASDRFVTMVRAGTLSHNGDPLLDEHVGNAKRVKTRSGFRPAKKSDSRHIDALVAAMLAVHALGDAVADGQVKEDTDVDLTIL